MSHTLTINGISFTFPYKPYPSQILSVSKIIDAIKNNKTAIIESPTGSGKSLSILVGVMGWLINENMLNTKIEQPQKRIIICSRTHTQITQLISQLKKTIYTPKVSILGSRKLTCLNPNVYKFNDINTLCKESIKKNACRWFLRKETVVKSISKSRDDNLTGNKIINKDNKKENITLVNMITSNKNIFDIESFISYSKKCTSCPYYALRSLSDTCDILFIPYNYLIDPVIRRSMDINTSNSIIIIDEAHNLDDICRNSGSIKINYFHLSSITKEIFNLFRKLPECKNSLLVINYFFKKIEELKNKIEEYYESKINKENNNSFMSHSINSNISKYSSFNTVQYTLKSTEIVEFLIKSEITFELLTKLKSMNEIFNKKTDENDLHTNMSEMMLRTIEGLLSILFLIFNDKTDSYGFIITLEKRKRKHHSKKNNFLSEQESVNEYEIQFVLLDPALIFNTLTYSSLILLSGTLAPFEFFERELNHHFTYKLIAPSIMKKNILVRKIEKYKNELINGNYENLQKKNFLDTLIMIIIELWSQYRRGGTVIFLPSYKCLNEIYTRMQEMVKNKYSSENKNNKLINKELKNNKNAINEDLKENVNNKTENKKPINNFSIKNVNEFLNDIYLENNETNDEIMKEYSAKCKLKKPILLAVYRGKLSEGIDFKDELARLLICIGLPYPNIKDPIVKLNKERKINWYSNQTYKALNQAIGRIVRHKNDWGGAFLVDNRVSRDRISKWIKEEMKSGSLENMIDEWKYFSNVKENEYVI